MRARFLLLAAIMAAISAAQAQVYKWKDADGRVQFSDRPPANAAVEEVKIRSFAGAAEVSVSDTNAAPAARVMMLSAAWCGVCKTARAYLQRNGIPFDEFDVEKTDAGRNEYRRLNGRGVPILLIGRQRMDGFNAARLEGMLRQE
jgi:glutaredoxin